MDRSRTAPVALLVTSAFFTAWSVLLVASPGGSRTIEWLQLIVGVASLGYAIRAYRSTRLAYNRRIRYVFLCYAVVGVVIVLGLSADQDSSRTWARLGWAAFIVGFVGSVIVWSRIDRFRPAVLAAGAIGVVLLVSGVGLTLNCDVAVQRTWCDANYEKEQALAERVRVAGELQQSGRAGGAQGAALMAYTLPSPAPIQDVTFPPGRWTYEDRPLQSRDLERGRFTGVDDVYSDCTIDVKVEQIPTGIRETILVSCGDPA